MAEHLKKLENLVLLTQSQLRPLCLVEWGTLFGQNPVEMCSHLDQLILQVVITRVLRQLLPKLIEKA